MDGCPGEPERPRRSLPVKPICRPFRLFSRSDRQSREWRGRHLPEQRASDPPNAFCRWSPAPKVAARVFHRFVVGHAASKSRQGAAAPYRLVGRAGSRAYRPAQAQMTGRVVFVVAIVTRHGRAGEGCGGAVKRGEDRPGAVRRGGRRKIFDRASFGDEKLAIRL